MTRRQRKRTVGAIAHASERLLERYGENYSEMFLAKVRCEIRQGRAVVIKKESLTRKEYLVSVEDHDYRLIWSNRHGGFIVTFLPGEEPPSAL